MKMARNNNITVKSESWLDLSKSATEMDRLNSMKKMRKQQVLSNNPNEDNDEPNLSNHRHSISNFYSISEHLQAANNKQQHNQHLLIRLRQQSYLNRSSNSLTSNLSNSVDLNASLVGAQSDSCYFKGGGRRRHSMIDEAQAGSSTRPLLKKESHRLRLLRNKLSLRGKLQPATSGSDELKAGQSSAPSPLARSLSSLSERLNGKLSHFRHSWKHFLYHYNRRGSRESSPASQREAAPDRASSKPSEAKERRLHEFGVHINKRQLTSDWLSIHHGEEAAER